MSFASQIISSVNSDTKDSNSRSQDESREIFSSSENGEETDVGFATDINTQIKDTPTLKTDKMVDSSSTPMTVVDEKKTGSGLSSYWTIPVFLLALIVIIREFYGNLFSHLGMSIDDIFEYISEGILVLYGFVKPLVEAIGKLLFGATKDETRTIAVGAKSLADTNATIVDEATADIIDDKNIKTVKINSKLHDDINKPSKKSQKPVENDSVSSSIQKKSDWCYIGEDQGRRVCAIQGDSMCMSEMVYPDLKSCMVLE